MLSRNKGFWHRLYRRSPFWRMKISTKITGLYAAILLVVLLVTSAIMGLGIYFSFYRRDWLRRAACRSSWSRGTSSRRAS